MARKFVVHIDGRPSPDEYEDIGLANARVEALRVAGLNASVVGGDQLAQAQAAGQGGGPAPAPALEPVDLAEQRRQAALQGEAQAAVAHSAGQADAAAGAGRAAPPEPGSLPDGR